MTRHDAIEEITRRLIEYYHPDRIYLFGSEARGEAGPESDLDFLVVVPDDTPREVLQGRGLYRQLGAVGVAKDVVPWPRSDFERRASHVPASLPATVIRKGRLLYDAGRIAA